MRRCSRGAMVIAPLAFVGCSLIVPFDGYSTVDAGIGDDAGAEADGFVGDDASLPRDGAFTGNDTDAASRDASDGSSVITDGSTPVNLAGTWTGTWASGPASGGLTATLTQSGSNINGSAMVSASPCASSASVSGTVSGTTTTFSITTSGTFAMDSSGTVSGAQWSGTYLSRGGTGTCAPANGTFFLHR